MEWYEKMEKFLFVNDFGQYLLNFLADRAEITGQSNSEKWNLFFEKVEGWKNQFFISSEPVELYGVNGWYGAGMVRRLQTRSSVMLLICRYLDRSFR